MQSWNSQRYRLEALHEGVPTDVVSNAIKVSERIHGIDPRLPKILTLRHLSETSQAPYGFLRSVASRETDFYKTFSLKKKIPGRAKSRVIHVPNRRLLHVQKWINTHVLRNTSAHASSIAYHPGSCAVAGIYGHCGCKWLLKIDLEDFFHSISERQVFDVFLSLGYTKLLSFELARITTVVGKPEITELQSNVSKWSQITKYRNVGIGFLPQGAPTSPMISNLVMRELDMKLNDFAESKGLFYTRYADDIAISSSDDRSISEIRLLRNVVHEYLNNSGFKENRRKAAISLSGSRRIVLGMLVDSDTPRLSKELKQSLRLHLYYLSSNSHGPSKHAADRGMSISTLYHHIRGKITWAQKVEPDFGSRVLNEFEKINWPPLDIYYKHE